MPKAGGVNGLPLHRIEIPDGSSADVYEHGATLTSWKSNHGEELLFLSSLAKFEPPSAIRGGVPVCWPQFSDLGPLKSQHGFARNTSWQVVEHSADSVTLALRPAHPSLERFPHHFEVHLRCAVGDNSVTQELSVTNTGREPFPFTTALHTYFRVSDSSQASVVGLKGVRYLDNLDGRQERMEHEEGVRFSGEVDRIYCGAPDVLKLVDPGRQCAVMVRKHGFQDAVVWNPWAEKSKAMGDLGDEDYKAMVCVEVAQAGSGAVTLLPGQTWKGSQTLEFTTLT